MATSKPGRTNEPPLGAEWNRCQIFLSVQWLQKERNFALYHYSDRVINHLWVWSSFVSKQRVKKQSNGFVADNNGHCDVPENIIGINRKLSNYKNGNTKYFIRSPRRI